MLIQVALCQGREGAGDATKQDSQSLKATAHNVFWKVPSPPIAAPQNTTQGQYFSREPRHLKKPHGIFPLQLWKPSCVWSTSWRQYFWNVCRCFWAHTRVWWVLYSPSAVEEGSGLDDSSNYLFIEPFYLTSGIRLTFRTLVSSAEGQTEIIILTSLLCSEHLWHNQVCRCLVSVPISRHMSLTSGSLRVTSIFLYVNEKTGIWGDPCVASRWYCFHGNQLHS